MTNPDFDKYLERLVASEEMTFALADDIETPADDALWNRRSHAHIITAICAVLREQREARCNHNWETPEDGIDGYMGASRCTKCGVATKRGRP